MPAPGVPNNPQGVNSWSGFGNEEPYGQVTKDASLARAAPMAGAPIASGPIQAPKKAGKAAQQPTPPPSPGPPPVAMSPDALLAQRWQAIAAIPGASPLVREYAQAAARRLGG